LTEVLDLRKRKWKNYGENYVHIKKILIERPMGEWENGSGR
jgi:hypothetical protein